MRARLFNLGRSPRRIWSQIDRPKWMVGRAVIDNELESAYKYPEPIMTFPLYRG